MNKNRTRQYAIEIVYQARYQAGYINKELQKVADLSKTDMGLLTTLVYGTIKQYEYLKAILLEQQPTLKVKKRVEVILVVALYQFLFLERIPDYAIINAAVELTKQYASVEVSRFVNALLRRIFVKREQLILPVSIHDETDNLALQYSMPAWLIKLLQAQYGTEKMLVFLQAIQQPARQFIRLNRLRNIPEENITKHQWKPTALPYCYENEKGNSSQTDDFLAGNYTIQNIASQSVGYFVNPQKYDKILDMCAAPGGKTTHLAELTEDTAEIIALDLYEHRVKQIDQNTKRLAITGITTKAADARFFLDEKGFDKILLDAPCSGLGVLAQKPEIRYTITPAAFDELENLQRTLLDTAWQNLREQGVLIYSTCTINRKENEKQIQQFLKKYPDANFLEERLFFDEMQQGFAGFYMAKIQKGATIIEGESR